MKSVQTLLALAFTTLLLLSGCAGTSDATTPTPPVEETRSLTELVEGIYQEKPLDIAVMTLPLDLSDENALKYNTGLNTSEGIEEGVVSEAMIGAQAYSLVLLRLTDGKDATSVATAMKEGIDQRKWICVEADDLSVATQGNLVLLIMVDSQLHEVTTSEDILKAFESVLSTDL